MLLHISIKKKRLKLWKFDKFNDHTNASAINTIDVIKSPNMLLHITKKKEKFDKSNEHTKNPHSAQIFLKKNLKKPQFRFFAQT